VFICDLQLDQDKLNAGSIEADALLLHAAPDLLAALRDELDAIRIWRKALVNGRERETSKLDVMLGIDISETKILAAIAKAEGQS
jgi:hypothetical protein